MGDSAGKWQQPALRLKVLGEGRLAQSPRLERWSGFLRPLRLAPLEAVCGARSSRLGSPMQARSGISCAEHWISQGCAFARRGQRKRGPVGWR